MASRAVAAVITASCAISETTAKPHGTSSVPGRRNAEIRSRSSPQPSERRARTAGKRSQGTRRLVTPSAGRLDAFEAHRLPRDLSGD
jgi:hypothetical protein